MPGSLSRQFFCENHSIYVTSLKLKLTIVSVAIFCHLSKELQFFGGFKWNLKLLLFFNHL